MRLCRVEGERHCRDDANNSKSEGSHGDLLGVETAGALSGRSRWHFQGGEPSGSSAAIGLCA